MNCTCRTTPWRIFLQGLVQVHKLEPLGGRPRSWYATPSMTISRTIEGRGGARALVTSSSKRQEASVAVIREDPVFSETLAHVEGGSARSSTVAVKEEDEGPVTPNQHSKPRPQPHPPKAEKRKKMKKRKNDAISAIGKSQTSASTAPSSSSNPTSTPSDEIFTETGNPKKQVQPWQTQKQALKDKFPEGWRPRKRLSPDALAGIRALNAQFPDTYTTQALADKFEVSAESIRRILKSKWVPSANEEQARQERWFRRGMQVWEHKAAVGVKPPKKWRREGIVRDPGYHEWKDKRVVKERQRDEEEIARESERRRGGGQGGL